MTSKVAKWDLETNWSLKPKLFISSPDIVSHKAENTGSCRNSIWGTMRLGKGPAIGQESSVAHLPSGSLK